MEIHFLNVGNGDCTIIKHDPVGNNASNITMIDINCGYICEHIKLPKNRQYSFVAGFSKPRGNYNEKEYPVNPLTWLSNEKIDKVYRFILTHPDEDHMTGLKGLVESNFAPLVFWDTVHNEKDKRFADWDVYKKLHAARNNTKVGGVHVMRFTESDKYKYFATDDIGGDGDRLTILHPFSTYEEIKKPNDLSYVILFKTAGGRRVLFGGDAEEELWVPIVNRHKDVLSNIDILFAPHHGRISGMDPNALTTLNPKLTILGNADSDDLDYHTYDNKKLFYLTQNQVGNVIVTEKDNLLQIYGTGAEFAEDFHKNNPKIENRPAIRKGGREAHFLYEL